MKLQFKQGHLPAFLHDELGFANYLNQFSLNYNLLPHYILNPLKPDDGKKHFQELEQLEKNLKKISTKKIFAISKLLNNPSESLNMDNLEQHNLFLLGKYLKSSLALIELEGTIALKGKDILEKANNLILKSTTPDYGCLQKNDIILKKEKEIIHIKETLSIETQVLENTIFNQTGIKMVYPYPHEIEKTNKIPKCTLIKTEKRNNHTLISYSPHKKMQHILTQKNNLEQEINTFYKDILKSISKGLSPLIVSLKTILKERINRCLQYSIIEAKMKNGFVYPRFSNTLKLVDAKLPALKALTPKRYQPLTIDLNHGSSVLFGANMTGKTTVLKTLFFHLTLIRFGLPIPASFVSLPFPHNVSIHLRSSGSTQRNLSSFGEELNFFSRTFHDGEYILVDEFFHSTNPTSGIELSKIFIENFNNKDVFFFCNSHYKEILECPSIDLFRMKDANIKKNKDNLIKDLIESIPFQIEKVDKESFSKNDIRPLEIALHFPLEQQLKDKIMEKLNHGTR